MPNSIYVPTFNLSSYVVDVVGEKRRNDEKVSLEEKCGLTKSNERNILIKVKLVCVDMNSMWRRELIFRSRLMLTNFRNDSLVSSMSIIA